MVFISRDPAVEHAYLEPREPHLKALATTERAADISHYSTVTLFARFLG